MLSRLENWLLFLTIFLIPTQLGKHFWPQFSFIYSLPVDYLSPTVYLWDILALFLFIIFLLQKKHINQGAINLFYFFILTQSLSLIFSQNIGVGLVRLEQYTAAGLFGVYMASVNFNEVKQLIFRALGLSVIMESVIAILQFSYGKTLGLWILGERSFSISTPGIAKFDFFWYQFLRPYGTFPHPNVLAGFMLTAPVILNLIQDPYRPRINAQRAGVQYGVTILAMIVTLLTVSRVAIIAGFIQSLILISKKWRKFLLYGVLIISPILLTRFSALLYYDSLPFIIREDLLQTSSKIFSHSPIFGVGLNNFIPISAEGIVAGPSRFLQPVHNIFLLALSETGIVGLVGLLVTFGYPILKLRTKNYELKTMLIIWGTILFLGLFDHYFLTLPQGYRLLFLIWGISFSMLEFKNGKSS
ncbi:hypothetical protein A3C59_00825 [Candidatus Daviesbacteria bacterium RIFCSPHIGHO2_02_FULL_36_13]|uniref:O-antigen ligase-related domain-containing protein n=1 Tax=Candidatus Daviesbacteria bacterium RIFCSPHIGHO2_02_FULL_36_13 TaxID=1797768 RepID=A0A1F5JRS6_9BACT|nr:MAG: hypothetical protein A3C59_00825 [Candidatus Daviesbacteria bacterium RIFCSPHIGHO2_02_FULL_36_13]